MEGAAARSSFIMRRLISSLLITLALWQPVRAEILAGLMQRLAFDEGSGGTLTNNGSQGGTWTVINSPTWTTPKVGRYSYTMTGSGFKAYSAAGLGPEFAAQITVAVWVKNNSPGGYSFFVSKRNDNDGFRIEVSVGGPGIGTSTTDDLVWSVSNGETAFRFTQDHVLADGQWHHFVGVFNAGVTQIYTDGALNTTTGTVGTFPSVGPSLTAEQWCIGARKDYSLPWTGSVDELRIYNVAFTAGQVLEVYNFERGWFRSRVVNGGFIRPTKSVGNQ